MFHSVPEEVLEEATEAIGVGSRRGEVVGDAEVGVGGLDRLPGVFDGGLDGDAVGRVEDGLAAREREDVPDDLVHAVVGVRDRREVLVGAGLFGGPEVGFRDVQWVPEVVAEDAGDLADADGVDHREQTGDVAEHEEATRLRAVTAVGVGDSDEVAARAGAAVEVDAGVAVDARDVDRRRLAARRLDGVERVEDRADRPALGVDCHGVVERRVRGSDDWVAVPDLVREDGVRVGCERNRRGVLSCHRLAPWLVSAVSSPVPAACGAVGRPVVRAPLVAPSGGCNWSEITLVAVDRWARGRACGVGRAAIE